MTRKKLIAIAIFLAIISCFFLIWLWPRSMESLVGIPNAKVSQVTLQADFEDATITLDSEAIGKLYTFSFFKPVYCKFLKFDGKSYNLTVFGNNEFKQFTLLEDGTLWDGTWSYKSVPTTPAKTSIQQWLQLAIP